MADRIKGILAKPKELEMLRKSLLSKSIALKGEKIIKRGSDYIIPIVDDYPKSLNKQYKVVEVSIKRSSKPKLFKELAKEIIPKEKFALLKTAYDMLGSIGILEIDKELYPYKKKLGEALLKSNKNLKTALRKSGSHEGDYRIQGFEYLAGDKTTVAIHKENNVFITLDISKMYFSPRLSTERKRIAGLIKPKEDVLVMFSGCAPYVCVISKNTRANSVVGVEINKDAHLYGLKNIDKNKVKNATLINGDVRKELPRLKEKFDRIIMPLPKNAGEFLKLAFLVCKDSAWIHMYEFAKEEEFEIIENFVKNTSKEHSFLASYVKTTKCGQQSPREYRICVDFHVKKQRSGQKIQRKPKKTLNKKAR